MGNSPYPSPALLLKVIRDGEVSSWKELKEYFVPEDTDAEWRARNLTIVGSHALPIIEELSGAGLIEVEENGSLKPAPKLFKILKAIRVSLTELTSREFQSILVRPMFGLPGRPKNKSKVFVIMPFLDELRPVYEDHVCYVCRELNLSVSRADDVFSTNTIVTDIWEKIYASKIVIADCTSRNANVFYEVGISHTIGRPTVLIAQDINDVPFDLQHLRCLVYKATDRGGKKFRAALAQVLKDEVLLAQSDIG